MRTCFLIFITGLLFCHCSSHQQGNTGFPAIIPLPVQVTVSDDAFLLSRSTVIYCTDSSLAPAVGLLNLYLQAVLQQELSVSATKPSGNYIAISLNTQLVPQKEGYHLQVSNDHIELTAHDAGAVIYGLQTLRQLWQPEKNNALAIPGCTITDHPRFAYRGMALDVSRHLFPVSFIKKYIDLLSLYKFNTFHWHLTDDQGWRIEIKQYPGLQETAAWRSETLIGHKKELPHRFDGKKYGGYYSQEEIKEIIAYATDRNITIIPEIEMPGHALAALAAYPALGCTGGPYQTARFWGIFDDVYCAGNDSTFTFLQNVLDEVITLFPSTYIHIGGDECPKTRWKACSKCQRRIKKQGLKDEHGLQSYFIQRIEKYLNSKGRSIIGWDEILEGGLAPNATVMSWRGEEGGIAAARQQHPVIMTPESHLYFDYYQSLYPEEPLAAGGYTPLQKVYSYEPVGDSISAAMLPYIKGVEGQAWSEYFTGTAQAEYMIFPRALALAEIAWTQRSGRDYNNFLQRLRQQEKLLQQLPVHYSSNFDEINSKAAVTGKGTIQVTLQSSVPGASIRYTTDNSEPGVQSTLYTAPVVINKSCTLKARLYNEQQQPMGRVFQKAFNMHKATGAAVVLQQPPAARFSTDATTLVNGLYGSNKYNDMEWLGYSGHDLSAVIDLDSIQAISMIGINCLNYHWQRMWAPVNLMFSISTDGEHYTKVYQQQSFPVNGINTIRANIKPVAARYIKVVAVNKGVIPPGEYGAGAKAWLLVDEIVVE